MGEFAMNGEMYQIASIVAAAKMAIQTNKEIEFTPTKYENSIKFEFLPKKIAFITKKYTASNISEWFEELKKNGLQDIKLLCPYAVKDRYLLGFSNTTESLILCFFKNGRVTYFVADWKFDSTQKKWNILYSEQEWENAPSEKPHFENNIDLTAIKPNNNLLDNDLSSLSDLATDVDTSNISLEPIKQENNLDLNQDNNKILEIIDVFSDKDDSYLKIHPLIQRKKLEIIDSLNNKII